MCVEQIIYNVLAPIILVLFALKLVVQSIGVEIICTGGGGGGGDSISYVQYKYLINI